MAYSDDNPLGPLTPHIMFWAMRIDADADVLLALVHDHVVRQDEIMKNAFEEDLDKMGERLALEALNAHADWRVEPVRQAKKKISKLSRGFEMKPSYLVDFFDGNDFAAELTAALSQPEAAPDHYPNMLVNVSIAFVQQVKPDIPSDFWIKDQLTQEFGMAVSGMGDAALGSVNEKDVSPLMSYFHHQRLGGMLEHIADHMRDAGRHNWATMAGALAQRNTQAADYIGHSVKEQIAGREELPRISLPRRDAPRP